MDEPLCFVHFIITLTCFQNKKGPFLLQQVLSANCYWSYPRSLRWLLLGMRTHQGRADKNQVVLVWWEDTVDS